ncbi:NAD(P)/FAD-dependent oxidoreductase [Jatrophihabitans lederbergiae]|uniref:FAD-dependent oxidoreductase n=1 Tax=Jatrophihabitans lederbergiae TaxID=3075547 RepID=A0ABU2JD92_9ACTN|nr:FAD-dependent oxidoreductase [Jatrophihabitans sp. DSM 44399]MDT0262952.1 FAD-dependent oxidoreductase [Jatrophihabitans sp. DSM 44399]
MSRRRIAVVGGGVAGLTAGYILSQHADVTLYEADSRLGGHAHTHELLDDDGQSVSVDTGFIVHNERTYPNLLRLFTELGVATQESEMSMSVSCGGCGLEYAGARGLGGLFPSVRNAANPRYLYLLTEVLRFHRQARALLAETPPGLQQTGPQESMDDFLARGRFSSYFRLHFVTPLISAVWSCSPELAGRYPARYLFEFLSNHGMLSVTGTPQWRTVVGGSASYVERAAKQLSAVQTTTPVRAVTRTGSGVEVRDDADQVARFDSIVIATHPHQALTLLTDPTAAERDTLAAIEYSLNPTSLHSDTSVLPRAKRTHSSWNYFLPSCEASASKVHVTYDMNRLQRLNSRTRYLVTLNDEGAVAPEKVLDRMLYEHPIFTPESVAAQAGLPALNDGTVAFAGAYHGWGFHEDGCRSGVEAALSLGSHW